MNLKQIYNLYYANIEQKNISQQQVMRVINDLNTLNDEIIAYLVANLKNIECCAAVKNTKLEVELRIHQIIYTMLFLNDKNYTYKEIADYLDLDEYIVQNIIESNIIENKTSNYLILAKSEVRMLSHNMKKEQ